MPPHGAQFFADRCLLFFLAAFVSLLTGAPALQRGLGFGLPAILGRGLVKNLGGRLNRSQRDAATRYFRGLMLVILCLALAGVASWLIDRRAFLPNAAPGGMPGGWLALDVLCLSFLLPFYPPIAQAGRLRRMIETKEAQAEATSPPDVHALARAAIEQLASALGERLVPIAFWYVLLGLPGAAITATLGLLARLYGGAGPGFEFGSAARRMNTVWKIVPLWLSFSCVLIAAIVTPGASPYRGGRALTKAPRPPVALLAAARFGGALGVTLGGPIRQDGVLQIRPWVGSGSAMVEPAAIRPAQYLYAISAAILLLMVGAGAAHPNGKRIGAHWQTAKDWVSSNLHVLN